MAWAPTWRLLDQAHARLVGAAARKFAAAGWETAAEVSYAEWGERGSIDLVAWHAATRVLAIIEVKTELASLEATLRKHDEKARLGATICRRRFGWDPVVVLRLLVLPEARTQRRHVEAHRDVLDRAYPERNRSVSAWIRDPGAVRTVVMASGASRDPAGILFLSDSQVGGTTPNRGVRQRVRLARRAPP